MRNVILSASTIALAAMLPSAVIAAPSFDSLCSFKGTACARQKTAPRTPRLIEFDAPGAATQVSPQCGNACGTQPLANNDRGLITGVYTDAQVVPHGFIRYTDGTIKSFDAPGAGLGPQLDQGTVPISINRSGDIGGQFQDSAYVYHGFIRSASGGFTTYDAAGAGTGASQGTFINSINGHGLAAGGYIDANNVYHGFIMTRRGLTSFDPPGSVYTWVCMETCLSDEGDAVGFFIDAANTFHGFVRDSGGHIAVIDAPGAGSGANQGTVVASINAAREIVGSYADSTGLGHGFMRSPNGVFTTVDVPGAFTTNLVSVNRSGAAAGVYLDAAFALHGVSRAQDGSLALFDAPGAGTTADTGTRPTTNNSRGDVTGYWIDGTGLNHGFVWLSGEPGDL